MATSSLKGLMNPKFIVGLSLVHVFLSAGLFYQTTHHDPNSHISQQDQEFGAELALACAVVSAGIAIWNKKSPIDPEAFTIYPL